MEFPAEPPKVFSISEEFLTKPFPLGLNVSTHCPHWLLHLGIATWDNLTELTPTFTVEKLMTSLPVDYYFHHWNDMQIFLTLGLMLSKDSSWHIFPDDHSIAWISLLVQFIYNAHFAILHNICQILTPFCQILSPFFAFCGKEDLLERHSYECKD